MSDAYDVLVVGAGPAGMTAAMTAARHGLGALLLDDNPAPGGQIWRGEQNTAIKSVGSVPRSFGTRAVGLATVVDEHPHRLVELADAIGLSPEAEFGPERKLEKPVEDLRVAEYAPLGPAPCIDVVG